jgi:drug/metabolite transporter (DMT)-like permease
MTIQLGILLAFVCAFTTNLAFLYKHRGACAAPAVHVRHPLRSASGLFHSRWFVVGMLVAVVAWVFHVAALALAPMSVVQAVLAGGVVMLAVMAERIFGFRVGLRQWMGLGLTALGLVLLVVTLPAVHSPQSQFSLPGMIAFEAGLLAVGALLIMGKRIGASDHHHGVMLGGAAGLLFGVSDVAIKAISGLVGDSGVIDGLLSPWTAVAVLASIAAFYASAKGLQEGDAVPVIALTGTAANVAGVAGGIIVFGDPLPGDTLGIVIQTTAFALVIVAAALTPAPLRAARAAVGGAAAA